MSTIRIEWNVSNIDTLIANGFDYQKIEAERPGAPGVWVELTRTHTRVPLVGTMDRYCYQDVSGTVDGAFAPDSNYRSTPWRSSDDATDTAIAITEKYLRGYCTISDIRDEGYAIAAWPDAVVQRGIERAANLIESLTKMWFEPRYRNFVFNGTGHDRLLLDIPIIALMKVEEDNVVLGLDYFKVFNRHLTQGQINPDDRRDPRVAFGEDYLPGYRSTRTMLNSRFGKGRKIIKLFGIYGFTELGDGDEVGETAVDSQIPLSLGQTPALIKRAATMLTISLMKPQSSSSSSALNKRITKIKTRDQEVSYADPDSDSEGQDYGLTDNEEVDNILMQFMPPMRVGAV